MRTNIIVDISDYEENVMAGMTIRQLALSILGLMIVVVSYVYVSRSMNMQIASYLAIGGGLPCFLFAFAQPQKMRLEQYMAMWLEGNSLQQTRYFEAENELYNEVLEDFDKLPRAVIRLIEKQNNEEENNNV